MFTLIQQHKRRLLAFAAPLLFAACGNLSHVTSEGQTDNPVWPDVAHDESVLKRGIYPNLESLKEVSEGQTKDMMYYLLGVPHFNELFWNVREWDYVLHFHTPGQGINDVTTCQFKVLYDREGLTRSFYWKPVQPQDAVCPPSPAPLTKRINLAADALFGFDSATLTPLAHQKLNQLAAQLRQSDDLRSITVYGHTDRIGSDAYNLSLSQQRADSVRNYLVQQGVPAHLISAQGLGKSQPVVQCHEANRNALISCLAPNRRVEVAVDGTVEVRLD